MTTGTAAPSIRGRRAPSERSRFGGYRSAMILCAGLCAVAGGCGEPVGTMDGRIVDAGRPLPLARIELKPANGEGRSFLGESVHDGRYYMETLAQEGIPPGKYQAIVTYHTLPDGKPLPGGERGTTLMDDGNTRAHRVAFDVEIKEGHQATDFDVSQGRPLAAPADH